MARAQEQGLVRQNDAPLGQGAPAMKERPVDLVHLSRYTLGDRELEREVLQLFRCQAGLYLERLRNAKDVRAWHDMAHTIKGSARSVGAWQVVRHAEAAEALTGMDDTARMSQIVGALDEAISEAGRFIDVLASHD